MCVCVCVRAVRGTCMYFRENGGRKGKGEGGACIYMVENLVQDHHREVAKLHVGSIGRGPKHNCGVFSRSWEKKKVGRAKVYVTSSLIWGEVFYKRDPQRFGGEGRRRGNKKEQNNWKKTGEEKK